MFFLLYVLCFVFIFFFFFQAEDGIRDLTVTGVQTCALPISNVAAAASIMGADIHPATARRWPDLEKLFGPNGAYSNCWCMWWRLRHRDFRVLQPAERKVWRPARSMPALPLRAA